MEEANNKDILVMKLIHYFMVKKDYVPIIIRGINNEVWLENPKGEFRIIRIVTKNIFNNEQFEFDSYKTKNIVTQIMKQTFNPFVDVLTIYTDIGDNFKKKMENTNKYKYITIEKEEDIDENEILNKYYKDIKDNMDFEEDGYDLLNRITNDISKKNINDSERYNENMNKNNKPLISFILIAINVIIFALMYMIGNGSEDSQTLINFGANIGTLTKNGEYYRLISCAFLHIGVIHLLCNMYSIYAVGPTVEYFFGKAKFLFIYFYSAITASLFALIFQGDKVITAGASGAIFGLLGALLYFGYTYRGYMGNKILSQVISVILINLYIGFTTTGISNAAHIGGLIGGLSMSFMLGADINEKKSSKINGIIITVILTAFLIYMAFFK
ncbi:MAG: rhomboid family intramembrane serine protease [Bacilli bacterium]|nr:rhomboid family intramembrane serine protease [Bacilli bacterium]